MSELVEEKAEKKVVPTVAFASGHWWAIVSVGDAEWLRERAPSQGHAEALASELACGVVELQMDYSDLRR